MAFERRALNPVGNTARPITDAGTASMQGSSVFWTYATNDADATVAASGYFNAASTNLHVGDIIMALLEAGAANNNVLQFYRVASITAGVVTTAKPTGFP